MRSRGIQGGAERLDTLYTYLGIINNKYLVKRRLPALVEAENVVPMHRYCCTADHHLFPSKSCSLRRIRCRGWPFLDSSSRMQERSCPENVFVDLTFCCSFLSLSRSHQAPFPNLHKYLKGIRLTDINSLSKLALVLSYVNTFVNVISHAHETNAFHLLSADPSLPLIRTSWPLTSDFRPDSSIHQRPTSCCFPHHSLDCHSTHYLHSSKNCLRYPWAA